MLSLVILQGTMYSCKESFLDIKTIQQDAQHLLKKKMASVPLFEHGVANTGINIRIIMPF